MRKGTPEVLNGASLSKENHKVKIVVFTPTKTNMAWKMTNVYKCSWEIHLQMGCFFIVMLVVEGVPGCAIPKP